MIDFERSAPAAGRTKNGVWAMAAALALVVVGALAAPIAAQATERTWQREVIRSESSLSDSQCFAANKCISVGAVTRPSGAEHGYVQKFIGNQWESTPAPSKSISSELEDLSCTDETHCIVVGSFLNSGGTELALGLKLSGENWSVHSVPVPSEAKSSRLEGVSCASSSYCIAAGSYVDSEGVRKPMLDSWNGSKWSAVTIEPPAGAKSSQFHDVACSSTTRCAAVGQYTNAEGESPALIEVWNGTTWTQGETSLYEIETTSEDLQSVACLNAEICVAVGKYEDAEGKSQPLGVSGFFEVSETNWTESEMPGVAEAETEFTGVSCSTTCFAAGTARKGGTAYPVVRSWLIWEWTGVGVVSLKDSGVSGYELSGVGCVPGETSRCQAVGTAIGQAEGIRKQLTYTYGIKEPSHTVGGATPESLTGVSCPTSSEEVWCMAVGHDDYAHSGEKNVSWILNGEGGWEEEPIPNANGYIDAVACSEPSGCTAVGFNGEPALVIKRWNGGSWTSQTPAPIEGELELVVPKAVSCPTESDCVLAGYYETGFFQLHPLVQRWNGSSWSMVSVPTTIEGQGPVTLEDISCSSSSNCLAVGIAAGKPAVERWNGSTWVAEFVPMPAESSGGLLAGVSCTSSSACTAVGSYFKSGGSFKPLIVRWNGSSWSLQTAPGGVDPLQDVACTSGTECVANSQTEPNTMIAWNGTSWSVEETKKAAVDGQIRSVASLACAAAEDCFAVGSVYGFGNESEPLAIRSE